MTSIPRVQRAIGCIVGSAVGDALGAPFEFGPPLQYLARFPSPVHGGIGEMVGGGGFGWAPGQFTDDSEMAVIVAESLLACDGVDADDQLERLRAWGARATDVGDLTREVLTSGLPASEAARSIVRSRGGSGTAGNGSLMRAAPGAVYFAQAGSDATIEAARALSAVTHADPLCQLAVAIMHELIRLFFDGVDALAATDETIGRLGPKAAETYAPLLDPSWTPDSDGPTNGSAMGALAQAVWAVRHGTSFADVVTSVIDLGGDTDSVAAVAGALAGAKFGIQAIPSRWLTYIHGHVYGVDGRLHRYNHVDLQKLAMSLAGSSVPADATDEPFLEPRLIVPGLWATNRAGARSLPADHAVVSLCRIDDSMRHELRREVYLVDDDGDHNPDLEAVVDDVLDSIDALMGEGRQVVVHSHGGRSRTGLILMAHLLRHGRSLPEATDLISERWPSGRLDNPTFADEIERRAG